MGREIARFPVPPDGHFELLVESGPLDVRFFLPGYLSASGQIDVDRDEFVDIGEVKLLGGDTDGNDLINADDLRRLGRGGGEEPRDLVLDINGDGLRNVFDLALAGLNLGRGEEVSCPISAPGDPAAPAILEVHTALHENNNLIIDFDVLLSRPGSVYVEYNNPEAGSFRSTATDGIAAQQNTSVVRLQALTSYCYQVFAVDEQGRTSPGFSGIFRAGPLPSSLNDAGFNVVQGQPTYPLTLKEHNATGFQGFLAIDDQGKIVWYYDAGKGTQAIAQKPDFDLVFQSSQRGLTEITPTGEIVDRLPLDCVGATDRIHHEVLVDGPNIIFLSSAIHPADFNGDIRNQTSDTIGIWNQATGEVEEVFDVFDHIDATVDRTASSDTNSGFFFRGCDGELEDPPEDWTHSNSLWQGAAGNTLMSMRHMNQIISIAPGYQSLEWRLGGPGGDFDFPNASDRFYQQHSAKEMPNGNILLFDNGNFRPEEQGGIYSRALELKLDFSTDPPTATKVWEYRHDPDLLSFCCSNVTRLDNGNTVIIFGADRDTDACCRDFVLVEADSNGDTVWELEISAPGQNVQYRVYPIDSLSGEIQR